MGVKPETLVVRNILKALHSECQGFYFKVHGSVFQRKGISDILGIHQGLFIAIEVKDPNNPNSVASPEQLRFIKRVNNAGGIGFVARTPEEAVQGIHEGLVRWTNEVRTVRLPKSRTTISKRRKG